MDNRIPGGFGGPGGPPNPRPDPRMWGGQALPGGMPQVVLHYLGGRLGKFMVTPGSGGREYFFCKGSPDVAMSLVEARAIVNQSPSEFTILASAPQARHRPAQPSRGPAPPRQPTASPAPVQPSVERHLSPDASPETSAPALDFMSRIPFAAAMEGKKAHRPTCRFYPRFPDWRFEGLEEIKAAGFELCALRACFASELKQAEEET